MKKYLLLVTAALLTFSAALTAAETYAYVEHDSTLYLDFCPRSTRKRLYRPACLRRRFHIRITYQQMGHSLSPHA